MNRSSKTFRVIGALCALANFVAVIFPVAIRTQVNYADQTAGIIAYLQCLFMKRTLPFDEIALNQQQMMIILGGFLVPLLLAIFVGIFGIFGDYKQIVSTLLAVLMFILFLIGYLNVSMLYGNIGKDIVYETGRAPLLFVVFSAFSVIFGMIGVICTPKMKKTSEWENAEIPEVQQMREEQIKQKYSMIPTEEEAGQNIPQNAPQPAETAGQPEIKPFTPGTPRGTLVGLRGMYAGAEIPMNDGEVIQIGRAGDNNLVFDGQNKVSRNHCKVVWNKKIGMYLLTDCSSNGTFVYGSQDCLPSNIEIEIQPGTAIALGDESNVLRLT